jgi:hypothetical protein
MWSVLSLNSRAALVGLTAVLAACDRSASTVVTPAASGHDHGSSGLVAVIDSTTEHELRALKRATAPFQTLAAAKAAGYSTQVTGCYENLPVGAMGWHYGDVSLFDATLEVTKPEVLLFERQRGGGMKLVGVEYIVPFAAWTSPNPPELLGQVFVKNLTFNVWALHAWVWKPNPRGVFADWNPNVSC